MFDSLEMGVAAVEKAVSELDPDVLEPGYALELVKLFSKVEKLGAAGKALAAGRVASSGQWRTGGDRSPAHLIARETGESVGAAVGAIETAQRLNRLPKTSEAFRSGTLTTAAAAEIAQAASVAPKEETRLLEVAKSEGIAGLRQEARRVIAQTCNDEKEKAERIHRSRYLRSWTDSEGAFRLDGRLAPEAGGEVMAVIDAIRKDISRRPCVANESGQALAADALLEMARAARNRKGKAFGPKALINVRVDYSALKRGHVVEGEVCEIPGIGPISVGAARSLASDSVLKVLVCRGTEVKALAHGGYNIPAKTRTVVVETYPECVVSGCHETKGLEIDHVIPWPKGATSPENLVRMCRHHHYFKTYRDFKLGPRKNGKATMRPPDHARSRASPRN